ncbi:MAG: NUDIX hydrolase [Hyphomicrobiaceae bacterium]
MRKRRQIAALPVKRREGNRIEVLLITSRDTGRWIIPKGWPWPKHSDRAAAEGEAWEEAGIRGSISHESIGTYRYEKRDGAKSRVLDVTVFVLEVGEEVEAWPEAEQRRREWFPLVKAATLVDEPELRSLILAYGEAVRIGPVR